MSNPTPDPVLVRAAQRMNARMAAAGARGAECATPELRMMASGFDVDGAHVNKLCALQARMILAQALKMYAGADDASDDEYAYAVAIACKSAMVSGLLLGLFAAQVAAEDRAAEKESQSADA